MTVPATSVEGTAEHAHSERARRILDAAGELLVAWGYRRVTIDEVARRAGVGKGTVYLHWKTKESLFLGVLLRSKSSSFTRQIARMREEPHEVLPSRMIRSMFLDMSEDPVGRAVYVGDTEVLGRLGETSARELGELGKEGHQALRRQFQLLREAGAMRTDLGIDAQVHLFSATAMGFFALQPVGYPFVSDDPVVVADTLAYTLRSALETGAGDIARTAPDVIALYEHLNGLYGQEITVQLRR